jgi:hypothetical protein
VTLQELCQKYGYSEGTIKKKWPQTQLKILKDTGVKIVKKGRGDSTEYIEEIEQYPRAITMFQEESSELFVSVDLNMINWDFHVFLAIVTTPMHVFRGTIDQLLQYMSVPPTADTRQKVFDALKSLVEGGFISYILDKSTSEEYFTLSLVREKEVKMRISYQMLLTCKELAEEEHKRSWIPLLKMWLGVQMLAEDQPYTVARLQALTGLSVYQIRECDRILQKNEIYRTKKVFVEPTVCLGKNVDLNGFYND